MNYDSYANVGPDGKAPEENVLIQWLRSTLEPESAAGTAGVMAAGMTPGVSTGVDFGDMILGIKDRDPLQAGLGALGVVLPGISTGLLKRGADSVRRGIAALPGNSIIRLLRSRAARRADDIDVRSIMDDIRADRGEPPSIRLRKRDRSGFVEVEGKYGSRWDVVDDDGVVIGWMDVGNLDLAPKDDIGRYQVVAKRNNPELVRVHPSPDLLSTRSPRMYNPSERIAIRFTGEGNEMSQRISEAALREAYLKPELGVFRFPDGYVGYRESLPPDLSWWNREAKDSRWLNKPIDQIMNQVAWDNRVIDPPASNKLLGSGE